MKELLLSLFLVLLFYVGMVAVFVVLCSIIPLITVILGVG